jgi:hypothetical protein
MEIWEDECNLEEREKVMRDNVKFDKMIFEQNLDPCPLIYIYLDQPFFGWFGHL